jgi:hypothetical protein
LKFIIFLIAVLLMAPSTSSATTSELTDALTGKSIIYEYSGCRSYHVKFDSSGFSYQYLTAAKPEKWWGPFPYNETTKENGEYIVTWFEKEYGNYITLVINFQ